MGCDLDPNFVEESKLLLVLTYAREMLNISSWIAGGEEVQAAARTYSKAMEAIKARKSMDVWEVPRALRAVQFFPKHILHHLSSHFRTFHCTT